MLTPAIPSPPSASPSTPSGPTYRAPGPQTDPGVGDPGHSIGWRMARAEVAVDRWAEACARIAARLAPAADCEVQ